MDAKRKTLKILIVEDLSSDAELMRVEIGKIFMPFEAQVLDNREDYLRALDEFAPDLILSDFRLPAFDGMAALRLARERRPDIPFIIITGSMNEETAVECMKAGAWDYVLKEHIGRLGPAVRQALELGDISRAKERTETEREEGHILLQSIIEGTSDAVYVKDTSGRYLLVNSAALRMIQKNLKDVLGRDDAALFSAADAAAVIEDDRRVLARAETKTYEERLTMPDGMSRTYLSTKGPIRDSKGKVIALFGSSRDITDRKKAEERLESALLEKEALLREIHHRVKNNMQVITSLLSLQSEAVKEGKILRMFKESQNRIRSMALIHEKLYQAKDLSRIDFADYLEGLAVHLFHVHQTNPNRIQLRLDLRKKTLLDINTAIPCGLIVNELVSNALQHAFPKGRAGHISVRLDHAGPKTYKLIVADDGVGWPAKLDVRKPKTLGLQIVNMLVEQVEGALTLRKVRGTRFEIVFKELKYRTRV